jgi:hypothetical protein
MPKLKDEAPAATTPAANGTAPVATGTPVVAEAKKARKPRTDMSKVVYALFKGSGCKKLVSTDDEVRAYIASMPAGKEGTVTVMKKVPLKVVPAQVSF